MRKWAIATAILVAGFWMYGYIGDINLVVENIITSKQLNYESPISAWTDAILFVAITAWATFLVIYFWKIRKVILNN